MIGHFFLSLYLLIAESLPFSHIPFSSFHPHLTSLPYRSQKIVRIKTFGGCKLKWDNREAGKAARSIRKFSRVSRFSHSHSENDTWFLSHSMYNNYMLVCVRVCVYVFRVPCVFIYTRIYVSIYIYVTIYIYI